MSLPEVRLTRQRIESCKRKDIQMFLKSQYLFGSRPIEVAGKLTSTDRLHSKHTIPYGPRGTDVWLSETDPPDPTWIQVLEMLLKIQLKEATVTELIKQAKQKVPVAIFKVAIAKQHLEPEEDYPFRLVALPLVDEYEPWAKELYSYFQSRGSEYVFPFNRQDVWDYISRRQLIFEGLTYRIKKYTLDNNVDAPKIIVGHPRKLKEHGLRHIRTNELITDYNFDGLDLGAMIGWSMGATQKISAAPMQTSTYAELRECWKRYIKKLCKPSQYNLCRIN